MLIIKEISLHRNGVGGTGFHVVLFDGSGCWHTANKNMVATVFPDAGNVAVLDADETAKGNISTGPDLITACCNVHDARRDAIEAVFAAWETGADSREVREKLAPLVRDLINESPAAVKIPRRQKQAPHPDKESP